MEIENFNQVQEEKRNEKYNEYVKKVTPMICTLFTGQSNVQ